MSMAFGVTVQYASEAIFKVSAFQVNSYVKQLNEMFLECALGYELTPLTTTTKMVSVVVPTRFCHSRLCKVLPYHRSSERVALMSMSS